MTIREDAGEARAFREIYEAHGHSVHRFLCDLLGDRSSADEALQETFVRAHRNLDKIREAEKLLPWLLGVARNVALEARRRAKREAPVEEAGLEQKAGPAPSPEAVLLAREADRVLDRALARLPEERRVALILQMDHGLGYAEIGELLGWSLAKVKVEIHRARQALRVDVQRYLK